MSIFRTLLGLEELQVSLVPKDHREHLGLTVRQDRQVQQDQLGQQDRRVKLGQQAQQ
jgi:hypothetical protein